MQSTFSKPDDFWSNFLVLAFVTTVGWLLLTVVNLYKCITDWLWVAVTLPGLAIITTHYQSTHTVFTLQYKNIYKLSCTWYCAYTVLIINIGVYTVVTCISQINSLTNFQIKMKVSIWFTFGFLSMPKWRKHSPTIEPTNSTPIEPLHALIFYLLISSFKLTSWLEGYKRLNYLLMVMT